jgi:thiamine pyrophosphate-dependent acetolactate synthase large subunit-like protein
LNWNVRRLDEARDIVRRLRAITPLRLCEEIKNFMQREAILSVDGQEILNFGRQSIPTFVPGHRLNSAPFGTIGVGLPFAVGTKAAKSSACTEMAHLGRTRSSSTPRSGTNCCSCA